MESVLLGLAVLACPVGMGLMMWFMAKGTRRQRSAPPKQGGSVDDLRAEHARLGAEIERLQADGESAERRIAEPARVGGVAGEDRAVEPRA